MRTPKRTAEANVLRDLERQLDDLRAEVRSARADTAATVAQMDRMARTIRVSRRALSEADVQAGWDRLRPDISLIRWKPRAGQQDYPEAGSGLIDRLKSGDPVADSLGNTDPAYEKMNLLTDPTLEAVPASAILTGTEQELGTGWYGKTVSGSFPASHPTITRHFTRSNMADNPLNSDLFVYETGAVTASGTHESILRSGSAGSTTVRRALPYIVGAMRLNSVYGDLGTATNVTSRTATIELYNVDEAVVRATRTVDLADVCAVANASYRLWVAYRVTAAEEYDLFQLRVKFTMVTTGSGGELDIYFGEPQLHHAPTADPVPFAPVLAGWQPWTWVLVASGVENEGGELWLLGEGTNDDWVFDNYAGQLRWFIEPYQQGQQGTIYMRLTTDDLQIGVGTAVYLSLLTSGAIEMGEVSAPDAPATGNVRIYAEDNGSGKTRLVARFPTGSPVVIATEP